MLYNVESSLYQGFISKLYSVKPFFLVYNLHCAKSYKKLQIISNNFGIKAKVYFDFSEVGG